MASTEEYVAYFLYFPENEGWVLNTVVHELETAECGIKCAVYERDFSRGGRYIMDLKLELLTSSKYIVAVLSPDFLKCTDAMHQIRMAVDDCKNTGVNKIISLVYKKCEVPIFLKCFQEINVWHKNWWRKFIDRLTRNPDVIDLKKIKPLVERNAMSDPVSDPVISEQVYCSLRPFENEYISSSSREIRRNISCPGRYSHSSSGSLEKQSTSGRRSGDEVFMVKHVQAANHFPGDPYDPDCKSTETVDSDDTEILANLDPRFIASPRISSRNK